jgi:hypothetical protein
MPVGAIVKNRPEKQWFPTPLQYETNIRKPRSSWVHHAQSDDSADDCGFHQRRLTPYCRLPFIPVRDDPLFQSVRLSVFTATRDPN